MYFFYTVEVLIHFILVAINSLFFHRAFNYVNLRFFPDKLSGGLLLKLQLRETYVDSENQCCSPVLHNVIIPIAFYITVASCSFRGVLS